jgi:hypothetical protein
VKASNILSGSRQKASMTGSAKAILHVHAVREKLDLNNLPDHLVQASRSGKQEAGDWSWIQ